MLSGAVEEVFDVCRKDFLLADLTNLNCALRGILEDAADWPLEIESVGAAAAIKFDAARNGDGSFGAVDDEGVGSLAEVNGYFQDARHRVGGKEIAAIIEFEIAWKGGGWAAEDEVNLLAGVVGIESEDRVGEECASGIGDFPCAAAAGAGDENVIDGVELEVGNLDIRQPNSKASPERISGGVGFESSQVSDAEAIDAVPCADEEGLPAVGVGEFG